MHLKIPILLSLFTQEANNRKNNIPSPLKISEEVKLAKQSGFKVDKEVSLFT